MKTNYTMSEIKQVVSNLKTKSLRQFEIDCNSEFTKKVEESAYMEFDFKIFDDCVNKINELIKKYPDESGWYMSKKYSAGDLFSFVQNRYRYSKNAESNKIRNQFGIIEDKLKTIRSADKAIEFLQLCEIELPAKNNPVQSDSPVDVDFIKSILPKNVLIEEGKES